MKLTKAILELKTSKEVENFLKDILTPNEIGAIEERWAIAKLLYKKELTYREIATELGTSTATVTRVGRFLLAESNNGYLTALKKIKGPQYY
ncbi:YerC/YecD family TrpR-related protein [Gammaproteobacteria bacterium]|jgi:TrpR-related protein YerC/YecD|nr:YerC/YecD family TrpR-related protein [Gammaproteobacteria bacterium]|tara:strand:- start:371 stop:646 length:276 start_codon:yes stop_codon:yes gene_type:complete